MTRSLLQTWTQNEFFDLPREGFSWLCYEIFVRKPAFRDLDRLRVAFVSVSILAPFAIFLILRLRDRSSPRASLAALGVSAAIFFFQLGYSDFYFHVDVVMWWTLLFLIVCGAPIVALSCSFAKIRLWARRLLIYLSVIGAFTITGLVAIIAGRPGV